ncbi:MAG: hypothetical protein K6G56_08480 [Clostridiales bacterium]|nr:hypothetical protein [Clostridiales bacterium]
MKKTFAIVFAVLLFAVICVPALANSPVPPQLEVYVDDAPEDLSLSLTINGGEKPDNFDIIKGVYCFYFNRTTSEDIVLNVSAGGRDYSFEVTEKMLKNGAALSFKSGEPVLTARPSNALMHVILNVVLTLVIEFIVLLLFGYRQGRTFLIFLITNLITQGLYNAFLYLTPGLSNTLYALAAAEVLIIVIEGLVYSLTFREYTKGRAWCYAIIANFASIILGTVITLVIGLLL